LQGKANPNTLSGVNRALPEMATYQSRLGYEVEIWGLSASPTLPPHEREYRLRVFPMTWLRVTLSRELKAALATLEPGTWIHFHSVFIPEFPAIAARLKKHGFAYSVTPHNGYAPGVFRKNPWKKHLYVFFREAKYLRNAAWIHVVGESEIQDNLRIAPQARVVLIPNGQETLEVLSNIEPIKAERPLIGFCGRLDMWVKGLDFLLDGFAAYKAKGGKGELWVIGDGADRAQLEERAAKNGLQTNIRFLGARLGEEKLGLIACFDIFVLCSRWEGLPMGCLEAASLGVPLFVSRETNLAKYVEENNAGVVLEETTAAGIERALDHIQQVYENGQLQPMGENARRLIQREFNWEENAKSFVAAIAACGYPIQRATSEFPPK
jgi:glycosyltransferase involved in cell wall biosynthesis